MGLLDGILDATMLRLEVEEAFRLMDEVRYAVRRCATVCARSAVSQKVGFGQSGILIPAGKCRRERS
jgi:hypothetical protein